MVAQLGDFGFARECPRKVLQGEKDFEGRFDHPVFTFNTPDVSIEHFRDIFCSLMFWPVLPGSLTQSSKCVLRMFYSAPRQRHRSCASLKAWGVLQQQFSDVSMFRIWGNQAHPFPRVERSAAAILGQPRPGSLDGPEFLPLHFHGIRMEDLGSPWMRRHTRLPWIHGTRDSR